MSEPLDELLAQLSSGDVSAAEQIFVAFEPYLRKAVRRHLPAHLRAQFDSVDILQSVWADAFRGFREAGWRFSDADHLRGFLFVAIRNRVIDRVRKHQRSPTCIQPAGRHDGLDALASTEPRPSEVAQATDLWERLLARCPPEHRQILELKREGHSLAEIALRTGLHGDSIRRILRTQARQLAFDSGSAS